MPLTLLFVDSKNALHKSLQFILDLLSLLSSLFGKLTQDIGLALDLISLGGSETTLLQNVFESSKLLGDIAVALVQLVEYTHVVLSVLVLRTLLKSLSLLLNLGSNISQIGTASELRNDSIERLDSTSNGIKISTGKTVSSSLFVDERDDVLLASAALEWDRFLAASGKPLDGGVRGNALIIGGSLAVASLSVNLGNYNVLIVGEIMRNSLPGGSKALAV